MLAHLSDGVFAWVVVLKLLRNTSFGKEVSFSDVHGAFPYKLYAEVIGSNAFGKFIVITSSHKIDISGDKATVEFDTGAYTKYRSPRYTIKVLKPLDVKSKDLKLTVYSIASTQ